MSRKDFVALANALRATKPEPNDVGRTAQWQLDVAAIQTALSVMGPKFDHNKWTTYMNAPVKRVREHAQSTYCGTMTDSELEEHVKECEVCARDFCVDGSY